MDTTLRQKILAEVAASPLLTYSWHGRGTAPVGYTRGLALAFGQCYLDLKAGTSAAVEMAKPIGGTGQDALAYFHEQLAAADMLDTKPADNLRHLFTIMYGLGMRESSGQYSEGRDVTARIPPSANTAEAGMFQQSWDSHSASRELPKLLAEYRLPGKECFLDVFREGVAKPITSNVGSGDGADFQRLAKQCPMFAVACAAVGLRNIRALWGPINRHEVEVKNAANNLLLRVQGLVDAVAAPTTAPASPKPAAPLPPPTPVAPSLPARPPAVLPPVDDRPWWKKLTDLTRPAPPTPTPAPSPVAQPPVAPPLPTTVTPVVPPPTPPVVQPALVVKNKWPLQRECDSFYGNPRNGAPWEASHLVDFTPPWRMVDEDSKRPVPHFKVHRLVKPSLDRIFARIWDTYHHSQAEIEAHHLHLFSGCYVFRNIRGSNSLSMHSYGIALDIAAGLNSLGAPYNPARGIPMEVVKCFEDEGWTWGGRWHGRPDAMHFQASRVS